MNEEKDLKTPADSMTDEQYKNFIISEYGHIKGLAKTLLTLRKSGETNAETVNGAVPRKRGAKEDAAVYGMINKDIEKARKLLNKLHVRITYSQKEKSFTDIPYHEILAIINEVRGILDQTEALHISPQVNRQRQDMFSDYIEY